MAEQTAAADGRLADVGVVMLVVMAMAVGVSTGRGRDCSILSRRGTVVIEGGRGGVVGRDGGRGHRVGLLLLLLLLLGGQDGQLL